MSEHQEFVERSIVYTPALIDRLGHDMAHYFLTRPVRIAVQAVLLFAAVCIGFFADGWPIAVFLGGAVVLFALLFAALLRRNTARTLRQQIRPGRRTARFFELEWHVWDDDSASQIKYSVYRRAYRYRSSIALVGEGKRTVFLPYELVPESVIGRFEASKP